MHVTILTIGSRGDVQPYLALAAEMVRRGMRVRFATLDRHGWLTEEVGVERVDLTEEPLKLLERSARAGIPGIVRDWRAFRESSIRAFREWREAVSDDTDVVVAHPLVTAAPVIARKAGVPFVGATTIPAIAPTRAFPMSYLMPRDRGPFLNRLSYELLPLVLGPTRRWAEEEFGVSVARDFHLRHPDGRPHHLLHGFSPRLFPRPREWPREWCATGFWHLPSKRSPGLPDGVEAFLRDGDPPVFVGFGSMVFGGDREWLTNALLRPFLDQGVRVLLAGGHALAPSELTRDPGVHFLPGAVSLPHTRLFPRMRAVVHHAGPGTFGSVLHAGVPQWALPFFADQPLWAEAIRRSGLGPPPLPIGRATDATLREGVRNLVRRSAPGGDAHARARAFAGLLRDEDGVRTTVDRIEAIAAAA